MTTWGIVRLSRRTLLHGVSYVESEMFINMFGVSI